MMEICVLQFCIKRVPLNKKFVYQVKIKHDKNKWEIILHSEMASILYKHEICQIPFNVNSGCRAVEMTFLDSLEHFVFKNVLQNRKKQYKKQKKQKRIPFQYVGYGCPCYTEHCNQKGLRLHLWHSYTMKPQEKSSISSL